jgi:SAM-dependent MidA family methyltransferase
LAHSERLRRRIAGEISAGEGWISFARYMELALYAPGLGYYSAGAAKLGADGDFTTAPELGALFARTLARQLAQVLRDGVADIVEFGAGSGRLARDLLMELAALDCLPQRYLILEPSADLRQRQQEFLRRELPQHVRRVAWLDALPAALNAAVIGNEVLDAMPVHMVTVGSAGIEECGVALRGGTFAWDARPAHGALRDIAHGLGLPRGYTTEINLAARSFMRTLAATLERGVILLIDYGFPAREYYHPQRSAGTLMCHYRHHAHDDPFCLVGLQDITAHVDFSAVANAALESGLDALGYVNLAQFLISCGITEVLAATPAGDTAAYLPLAAQAQQLLSPAEMGELFKVIALGRNYPLPLSGFAHGNKQPLL